jgi:NAD(P)-dependent dehydrogenase (short-subunit alcohol dehydrogenase family)
MRLNGKTAVITGAAGDIGSAAARRFEQEGARLVLIDRDEHGLADCGKLLVNRPLGLVADVTNEDSIRRAAEAAKAEYETIDILFVNAGIEQSHTPLVDMEKGAFERVVAVNLTGAFLTAKHFLPLVRDRGSIIFTSSLAALVALPAYSAYSASKAGLIGLMRSAAADVGVRGVRCNTVHPGPVQSKMLERSALMASEGGSTDGFYAAMAGMAKLGRLIRPDDVAALALFLASDESAMITGQSIAVDGGIVE